jgi:hypothetical protein
MDQGDIVRIAKLDRDLRSVERGLRNLPDVLTRRLEDRQGEAESDDRLADRLAFQDEWWNLIDRLDLLRIAYASGEMAAPQRRTFEALCPIILDDGPLIRDLGLRAPTPETLDVARQVAGRDIVTRSA